MVVICSVFSPRINQSKLLLWRKVTGALAAKTWETGFVLFIFGVGQVLLEHELSFSSSRFEFIPLKGWINAVMALTICVKVRN